MIEIKESNLTIKQIIEPLEIFTSISTKNKYEIEDQNSKPLYYAYEVSNFFMNQLLNKHRPLKMVIVDNDKNIQMTIEKAFHFLKARYMVKDNKENIIGYIRQRRWFITKSFDICDKDDMAYYTCTAKFPHLWTFKIFQQEMHVGTILKKWSGIGKEAFTDADNFQINYANIKEHKHLVLAAAFAIDLSVFERRK
ncbi:hypothetical protein COV93_04870 [Candidatus Woesearchaeota archaeon CG11_big_fil_rev_8_21_14_0_20_43_8]|nr:MAG: hypothetical protein COV93_04870 [Candidatus Woesearchaeota archaeon CG11_big_fil_rev_8_21_14_0_20_43_8]PIO07562.1 MAG: hypothetical protein COT47_01345 [Candidatus Woesearchaeota archaeon CG08_land_8_20_14_0_20_43_7]